jgi:hypothetical protein
MAYTKEGLYERYKIQRKALDDTLKALGINHRELSYSDELVNDWIDPAREMIKGGKKIDEVKAWVAERKKNGEEPIDKKTQSIDESSDSYEKISREVEGVAQDFVDTMMEKALKQELANPLASLKRVVDGMSSQDIKSLINSRNYKERLGRMLPGATPDEPNERALKLKQVEQDFQNEDPADDLDEWANNTVDVDARSGDDTNKG